MRHRREPPQTPHFDDLEFEIVRWDQLTVEQRTALRARPASGTLVRVTAHDDQYRDERGTPPHALAPVQGDSFNDLARAVLDARHILEMFVREHAQRAAA